MNRSKLKFVSLILVGILISSVSSFAHTGTQSDYDVDQHILNSAIKFRDMYGLNSEQNNVLEIMANNDLNTNLEKHLGFPLTSEELEIIKQRDELMDDSIEFRKLLLEDKYSDLFGGSYFDAKTGMTTILLTDLEKEKEIYELFPNKSYLTFQKADYTLKELNNALQIILKNRDRISFNGIGIDEKQNKITIYHSNDDIDKEYLTNIINQDYLTFKEGSFSLLNNTTVGNQETDNQEIMGNVNLELGVQVTGHSVGGLVQRHCSSGFFGIDHQNYVVMVTAGHCNRIGSTSDWYKGFMSDYIGQFNRKVVGTTQNSDASTVRLTSSVNYESKVDNYYITSVNDDQVQVYV